MNRKRCSLPKGRACFVLCTVALTLTASSQKVSGEPDRGELIYRSIAVGPCPLTISARHGITLREREPEGDSQLRDVAGDPIKDSDVGRKVDVEAHSGQAGRFLDPRHYALQEASGHETSGLSVEPYLGFSYVYLDTRLDPPGSGSRAIGRGGGWFEPMLGFQSFWELAGPWNFRFGAEASPFAPGSHPVWSAHGLLGYRIPFSQKVLGDLLFGYRFLHQSNEAAFVGERAGYLETVQGPVLGLSLALSP